MVDALDQTTIDQIREEHAGDGKALARIRKYTKGEQERPLTPEQRRILGRRAKNQLSDNILAMILATIAARLDLTGFEVDEGESEAVATFLAELWMRNKGPALQYRVNVATLRDGNHAVSLRWRASGRVSLHQERWWDGEQGIFVAYDDAGDPAWAVKEWTEKLQDGSRRTTTRRTVYYPDKIIRLARQGGGWEPIALPGDPESPTPGIVPWTRVDGTPLGLPVVHFAAESGDDNQYGQSVIGGLIGLQDDVNALQYDLTAAAAFTGFQQYWVSGADADETKPAMIVGPGRTWELSDPAARAGVLPPGDMSRLIEVYQQKVQSMTTASSVPLHLITGGSWPSGEALLRAEMPLVDRATRLARQIGPGWVEVAHRATELANVFGGAALDEDAPITAVFAPAERLDEKTRIAVDRDRVNLYGAVAAIPDETLIRKTDLLDEEELAALMAERAARAEQAAIGVLA